MFVHMYLTEMNKKTKNVRSPVILKCGNSYLKCEPVTLKVRPVIWNVRPFIWNVIPGI